MMDLKIKVKKLLMNMFKKIKELFYLIKKIKGQGLQEIKE
jgi:hypothetical protein